MGAQSHVTLMYGNHTIHINNLLLCFRVLILLLVLLDWTILLRVYSKPTDVWFLNMLDDTTPPQQGCVISERLWPFQAYLKRQFYFTIQIKVFMINTWPDRSQTIRILLLLIQIFTKNVTWWLIWFMPRTYEIKHTKLIICRYEWMVKIC